MRDVADPAMAPAKMCFLMSFQVGGDDVCNFKGLVWSWLSSFLSSAALLLK